MKTQLRVPAAVLLLQRMKLLHRKRLEIEETDVQNPQGVVGIHHLLDPVIVMAEETLSEILVLAG